MIIDCHFHLDETMLSVEEMVVSMDKNGVNKTVLIAKVNETMFQTEDPEALNLGNIFRYMLLNDPIQAMPLYQDLVKDGYFMGFKIINEPDNAGVANAIARFPNRLMGWITINPLLPGYLDDIDEFLHKPGFIGVKAHPFMHNYNICELDQVASICQEKGKPMLIHLSAEPNSYKYLPEKYPRLKLIYAHAGIPFWKDLWQFIKDKPNIYVDLSSDYLNDSLVDMTVQYLGFRKCLYGCDGPYGTTKYNEYDYNVKKSWVEALQIPDSQKEYILGSNFLELID
jgi:predicted TIM-barrel fold metal-dependent hydrolase